MSIRKWDKYIRIKVKKLKEMRKLIKTKKLTKGEITMENTMVRPCTPAESLKQSLLEMKHIRNGQAPKRNLDDFLNQLEKELEDEGK